MDDKTFSMKIIEGRDLYRIQLKHLHSINEIDFYYKLLIQSFFNMSNTIVALSPESIFESEQEKIIQNALEGLKEQKPLQYIIGEVQFRNLKLKVNSNVLIPRPETEDLVDWIIEDYINIEGSKKLVDFGTGTGCIAISLAKEQPLFEITAIDIDQAILDLAFRNAKENKININYIKHDLTKLESLDLKVDIIVSNPPYITPNERETMETNVLNHEPHQALFVPQDDPLLFYRAILDYAQLNLIKKGNLYFEFNPLFLKEMRNLVRSYSSYIITERKDIFDKVRMLRLEKK
jgi:release factor glutamine methyltransferase